MSRSIDHSNYEAWLLDRLEGNLTPGQERQLDAFLAANPGLDIDDGDLPSLADMEVALSRSDKDALKRSLPPTGLPGEPIDDFLIARLEGDLTAAQDEALRLYLLDHPEHQRAERIYTHTKLLPHSQQFMDKAALHRQLPPVGLPARHTLDDHLVARMEGDLDPAQELALSAYIASDPAAQRAWALMQHARIVPQPVVYAHKDGLRKGGRVIAIGGGGSAWRTVFRAAAVIAILLTSGIWIMQQGPHQGPEVAVTNKGVEPVPGTFQGAATNTSTPAQDVTKSGPGTSMKDPVQDGRTVPKDVRPGTDTVDEMMPPVIDRSSPARFAQGRPVLPSVEVPQRMPVVLPPPDEDLVAFAGFGEEQHTAAQQAGVRLGDLLAGTLRKQVLDVPPDDHRPLDTGDAYAALDKGLRKVAGDAAGLEVERTSAGRLHRFDLRLGRNLSISASR